MLEQGFQKDVMDFIKETYKEKYWGFKVIVSNKKGTPDFHFSLYGIYMSIEFKKGTEYTPLQLRNIRLINRTGGIAFGLDYNTDKNWKEIILGLKQRIREKIKEINLLLAEN